MTTKLDTAVTDLTRAVSRLHAASARFTHSAQRLRRIARARGVAR